MLIVLVVTVVLEKERKEEEEEKGDRLRHPEKGLKELPVREQRKQPQAAGSRKPGLPQRVQTRWAVACAVAQREGCD